MRDYAEVEIADAATLREWLERHRWQTIAGGTSHRAFRCHDAGGF